MSKWLKYFLGLLGDERGSVGPGDDGGDSGDDGVNEDGNGDDEGNDDGGNDGGNEGSEEEINGVKYKKDSEGNFCLNGIAVLDPKKVPFKNRAKEWQRKAGETESRYQDRINELQQKGFERDNKNNNEEEEHDDSEIDQKTGFTYGQKKALEKQLGRKLEKADIENKTLIAGMAIDGQKNILRNDKKYKKFFDNEEYVEELERNLENLPIPAKLTPGIVKSAIHLVMGQHIEDFTKNAIETGKKTERENRQIVSEIVLGASAGSNAGKKIIINEEIKTIMSQTGMNEVDAAEVWQSRQDNKSKKK